MKARNLITSLILIVSMAACNIPVAATSEPALTQTALPATSTQTVSTIAPSSTPLPTNTVPPTSTSTPTVPSVTPIDRGVNCRFGPGTDWLVIGALLVGQTANIQGRNGDSSWWYVSTPNEPGRPCWVAASVTTAAGNLSNIPVVSEPDASVIDVGVEVEPETITVAGCLGPIQPIKITGGIETNGPATVKWHFETQQGGSMATQTTEFDIADEREVSADYTPPLLAGTYWVRLVITSPNNDSAETSYKIECP